MKKKYLLISIMLVLLLICIFAVTKLPQKNRDNDSSTTSNYNSKSSTEDSGVVQSESRNYAESSTGSTKTESSATNDFKEVKKSDVPQVFFGRWENKNINDQFEFSEDTFIVISGGVKSEFQISKVYKSGTGYVFQTNDDQKFYLTIKNNKLYPTTSEQDFKSSTVEEMAFEKK